MRPLWHSAALDLSRPHSSTPTRDFIWRWLPPHFRTLIDPFRLSATRPITLPIPLSPTFIIFFFPPPNRTSTGPPPPFDAGRRPKIEESASLGTRQTGPGIGLRKRARPFPTFILARLRRIHWLTRHDKRLLRTLIATFGIDSKKASCNHSHSLCGASLFERHLLSVACRSLPGVLGCQGVPGVARPARVRSSPQRQNPGSGGV